ncbi:MAG: ester cyclase [Rubrobacteraceae bacterium]
MSANENKAVLRSAIKEFNEGNLEGYLAHYDESLVTHGYPPELPANLDGIKAFYAMMFSAFTDANVELHEVLSEGDEVAARYTFRAKHTGDFMGIPPTNKEVSMGGITILRLRDGKIVERWQNADLMGLMQQLGAIPAPEGAEA